MRYSIAFLILALGIPFVPSSTLGQWQPDGVPVCMAGNGQYVPTIVPDGAGGAFIAWQDDRDGNMDIYVQNVDALGVPQWTPEGVALCTAAGGQYSPTLVADAAGGAIVTWIDQRPATGGIYARRVDASGTPQWTADGVALCTAANDQLYPTIVSDGAGGAIVTWFDDRSVPFSHDIYARRVDASGTPQWTPDGVALCTAANAQIGPTIVSDGAGGAIVTWWDYRLGGTADIYVRRVDASGTPQWTPDGVALCTAAWEQHHPAIVSDGSGGAIVTWEDERSDDGDIYARRVDAGGVPQWTGDGVVLCAAGYEQFLPSMVADGVGGAIVTWADTRSFSSAADVYAQRVDDEGVSQWTDDGVALCTAGGTQHDPKLVADGAAGAIVTWHDRRSSTLFADIYAQRVDSDGAPLWTGDGVALCTAGADQTNPAIASDGSGGAIVVWQDERDGDANTDIYAQRVSDPPNAVAIVSFDAFAAGGVVTLRSTFRSNLGVEAVHVYRGAGAGEDAIALIARYDAVEDDYFEYVDRDVAPGETYRYRIGVVDADGEFLSPVVTVSVGSIAGGLSQNRPNPFNPTTTIPFVLSARERVTLEIYDAGGRRIRTLVDEVRGHGAHEATWDGRDDQGVPMGSGVYFYQLRAGKRAESNKMVLVK
jgi:hypothetical protein